MSAQQVRTVDRGLGNDKLGLNSIVDELYISDISDIVNTIIKATGVADGARKQLGDTTGDGHEDLIVFGTHELHELNKLIPGSPFSVKWHGAYVFRNTGNGTFADPVLVAPGFGNYNDNFHIRSAARLRQVPYVDLIGFHDDGVWVSLNEGQGQFNDIIPASSSFGRKSLDAVADNWDAARHVRCLADVTGDGVLDILGFHETKVYVALGKGNGTFGPIAPVIQRVFTHSGGWAVGEDHRVLADLTGNKRADIVGFKEGGVWVALSNGDGTFAPPREAIKNFGAGVAGWGTKKHTAFVIDVTGNHRGDIVVFGDKGVMIAIGNGDGTFQKEKLVLEHFGSLPAAGGWEAGEHPNRLVVALKPGKPGDIIGFRDGQVWMSRNDGKGHFAEPIEWVRNDGANPAGPAPRPTAPFTYFSLGVGSPRI